MIYPWQQEQWHQFERAIESKRLPHALLLTGIAGMGKAQFADNMARRLLCATPETGRSAAQANILFSNDQFSGLLDQCHCHACHLITGKTHPNMRWIQPEKAGQAIKVDDIRNVSEFVSQTSLQGTYRIVIIHPANKMNANAANALLKTLEEPSSDALIILVSDQDAHLPATIVSRCQRIVFHRPPDEIAMTWLKRQAIAPALDAALLLRLANGAPMAALQLVQGDFLSQRQSVFQALILLSDKNADPLSSAANAQTLESLSLFDLIITWTMDVMRLQLNCQDNTLLNSDYISALTTLAARLSMQKTARYLQYLQHCHHQLLTGLNLNKQLLIESAFIRWMECTSCFS